MSNSVIEAFKGINVASAHDLTEHEAIFEVSYQYLSKIKDFRDLKSFHYCLVSLINSDKYYRALQLIKEVPNEIHQEYPLEKAYVYYKTGKVDLLRDVYESTINSNDISDALSRGLKHVVAQSYYQTGKYDAALQLYSELISTNAVDGTVDLACNERAILSQIAMKSGSCPVPQSTVSDSTETYDIIFNNALIKLASGNYDESLQLLKSALSQCEEQNLDSEPTELMMEVSPIKLTVAYIYQLSGRIDEAVEVLSSLDLTFITDLMVQLIIKNNYKSLHPSEENVNFVARELDYQFHFHHLRQKLTPIQRHTLLKNHLLLSYQSKSLSKSSKYLTNRFYKEYSDSFNGDVTPLIYKVLITLDITLEDLESPSQNTAVAKKIFKFARGKLESNDISDILVAAAILLVSVNTVSGNYDQSLLILEKLVEVELSSSPETLHASIFGLIFTLYEQRNYSKKLNSLQNALLQKFESLGSEVLQRNPHLYYFVRAFAFKYLNAGSEEKSLHLFGILHSTRKDDSIVSSVVNKDNGSLAPMESLASNESIEELLSVNVETLVSAENPVNRAVPAKKPVHKVTKKKQKPKFSKHKFFKPDHEFDPAKDLDSERWLPLKLRSNYRPSKKDLKKKSGGHQGAIESSPAPQTAAHSSSTSTKSKSKGKKKKGKK
ncbi:putative signal recognition particle subunit [Clavispora lusitaniae]|uniref:Signal recognition particle subunit SRP72 n=1 Tax=Clavispora lusitaniae TaxID=36911 RepID=A0AA91T468_CLALS|nr:Signal recognition particle core component [Clavispora lusitaniae]OVF10907.1 putative signal recognition particle subunit [Clavispora lusitaniae]